MDYVFNNYNLFYTIHKFYSGYCLFHQIVLVNKGCSQIAKHRLIFELSYRALALELAIGLEVTFITEKFQVIDLIFGDPRCVVLDEKVVVFNKRHINKPPKHDFSEYDCQRCEKKLHEFVCGWCNHTFEPIKDETLNSCEMYEDSDGDYGFCGIFNNERQEMIHHKRKSAYLSNVISDKARAAKLIQSSQLDEDHKQMLQLIIDFPYTNTFASTPITYTSQAHISVSIFFDNEQMQDLDTFLISVDFVKILQYDKEALKTLGIVLKFEKYVKTRGWPWVLKHSMDYLNGTYRHKRKRY